MTRARRIALRARDFARTARDLFPFTALGVLVLSGCALALVRYGLRQIDLVLLIVGGVGLAVGAITLLSSSITALALWLSLRRAPAGAPIKLECGFAARTGFSLPTLWYVPFVKLSWKWVNPEAKVTLIPQKRRLHEEVVPQRRALLEEIVRRVEVGDAFGFTRVSFTVRERRDVRLTPSVGALRQMHVVRSIAGGDNITHPAGPPEGERADMRHYAPGDPIKFVLWKVFARSRQLVVRTPERAISPVRQTVAFLVTGAGDEPAAGAARVAVDSGALGSEWVLGADGTDTFAKTPQQALEVLARSSNTAIENGGTGLTHFLSNATPGAVGRAVVFVPGRPGPWLDRVVAAARARTSAADRMSSVEFVVCTDGITRVPKRGWLARVATDDASPKVPGAPDPVPASELAKVVNALGAARARVLVVDRVAGRVYGDGHHRVLEAA